MSAIQLAAVATSLLPGVSFTSVREMQGKYDEFRYALISDSNNQNYVLMVPRDVKYTDKFNQEINNTKLLENRFTVPKIIANNDKMVVYAPYSGKSYHSSILNSTQVKSLASSLATLHSLPFSIAEQNSLPIWTNQQLLKNLMDVLDEAVSTGKVGDELANRFEKTLDTNAYWGYDSVIINGDLTENTTIFIEDKVRYMLNWSSLQASDPALDLQEILPKLNDANNKLFISEYNKTRKKLNKHYLEDEYLNEKAEFYANFHLISELLNAKSAGDDAKIEEIADKLAMLDDKLRLGDELLEAERVADQKAREYELAKTLQEIKDNQLTERLDAGKSAIPNGDTEQIPTQALDFTDNNNVDSQTTKPEQAANIQPLSPAEQELLNMLNNDSGKSDLRHQPAVNTKDNIPQVTGAMINQVSNKVSENQSKKTNVSGSNNNDINQISGSINTSGKFSLADYTGEISNLNFED